MHHQEFAEKRRQLLDAFRHAYEKQDQAAKTWFAIHNTESPEFESAQNAYMIANAEVNRLIVELNSLRRR